MAEKVYKIVLADDWKRAIDEGQFLGAGIDLKDGFIHLSTRKQVQETATGILRLGPMRSNLGSS